MTLINTASRTRNLLPSLLCAALSLGAWQAAIAATAQDTLIIGKPADPQTLDPAVTFDNNDWTITYPSYQRLVGYKTDGEFPAVVHLLWRGQVEAVGVAGVCAVAVRQSSGQVRVWAAWRAVPGAWLRARRERQCV